MEFVKRLPALNSYVGQTIVIWGSNSARGFGGDTRSGSLLEIVRPDQLQLLSTALADPKKTPCFMPRALWGAASNAPQAGPAEPASPAAAVTVNNQPVAPMQPATSAILATAAASTEVSSNSVSPAQAPSTCPSVPPLPGSGRPLKGTVTGVHTDPQLFGTDIVIRQEEQKASRLQYAVD